MVNYRRKIKNIRRNKIITERDSRFSLSMVNHSSFGSSRPPNLNLYTGWLIELKWSSHIMKADLIILRVVMKREFASCRTQRNFEGNMILPTR